MAHIMMSFGVIVALVLFAFENKGYVGFLV